MSWHLVIKLLDESGNILASEDMIDNVRLDWKTSVKTELVRVESENIMIDWKKISIIIEKV